MKKLSLVIAFSLAFLIVIAQSAYPYVVPNKDWIKYFSSRGNVTNGPTAIDANNNMYLTGYTGSSPSACNILTQKRDSLGNLVFSNVYNNGNYDKGNAIKLNGQNVHVAGVSYASTTNNDYIILKYSGTGTTFWNYRYDYNGLDDEAMDLKVDAAGNTYVTGKATNTNGDFDIVTIKLNASGVLQWSHVYNGSGNMDDVGVSLVLVGNKVVVSGQTTDPVNGTEIVAFEIDRTSGTQGWSTILSGTANGNDKANAMVVSGADVIICGEMLNTTTGLDAVLIRLDGSTGVTVYQQNYDYNNSSNRATALVRDSTGNIGMVGTALNGTVYEYHTVLYDSTGAQKWLNKESTSLSSITVDPRIACDTIAHHFYVCGEILKQTKDIFAYQISTGGNTSWKQSIDGQNSDVDAAIGLAVNGVGVVYLAALSKNSTSAYDYTSIKINQTPVYFPPDIVTGEKPLDSHLYYGNKGQIINNGTNSVASNVICATMDFYYPETHLLTDRISYKLYNHSPANNGTDTLQRIDVIMLNANPLAEYYPFEPSLGTQSYMQQDLPDAVVGVQGYRRYFAPNIYPGIDLHYFSNQNGLKMYYVLKPMADPGTIKWEIAGANSTAIVSNKLEVRGFNKTVKFNQPKAYTVNNAGAPIPLTGTATANWINNGFYGISVPSHNPAWPLIIEIDYGNTATSAASPTDNLSYCTYYGGTPDDGFTDIDVDKSNGDFVVLGSSLPITLGGTKFPTVPGTTVSSNTQNNSLKTYFTVVLFDKDGIRKAANTYGGLPVGTIYPLKVVLNKNRITVVGNTNQTGVLPTFNSVTQYGPNTYTTNTTGEGFVMQFQYVPLGNNPTPYGNINKLTWNSRLNGFASDIDKTPDGKHIYIVSYYDNVPTDTKTLSGAYNNGGQTIGVSGSYNFKVSKFDTTGQRIWASMIPVINSAGTSAFYNSFNTTTNDVLPGDNKLKCRIACSNYGFYLVGESNDYSGSFFAYSKYGFPYFPLGTLSQKKAFIAGFNKRDSITFCSYIGATSGKECYNDVAVVGPNEIVAVGYSNSYDTNVGQICRKSNPWEYVDSTMKQTPWPSTAPAKMLITKFDTLGVVRWSTLFGDTNSTVDCIGWGVTSDNNGKIYVTGKETGNFSFPATNPTGLYSQTGFNQTETFIACFGYNNTPVWNTRFGGSAKEVGLAVKHNPLSNNLILTGITNSPPNNGTNSDFPILINNITHPLSWNQQNLGVTGSFSNYDGYIAFFNSAAVVGLDEFNKGVNNEDNFSLFPNPARTYCTILFNEKFGDKVVVEIYNVLGQLMVSKQIVAENHLELVINTEQLSTGLYIVNIVSKRGLTSKKLIINK